MSESRHRRKKEVSCAELMISNLDRLSSYLAVLWEINKHVDTEEKDGIKQCQSNLNFKPVESVSSMTETLI